MPSMTPELCFGAVESSIANTIGQFERTPDLFLREADLLAMFFHALMQQEQLTEEGYITRDGRRTGLVHRQCPLASTPEDPVDTEEQLTPSACDVVILNPQFVRSHKLEAIARLCDQGVQTLSRHRAKDRPPPLLAAINLRLVEDLSPPTQARLATDLEALARSSPDAHGSYMAIFCRHWDLSRQISQSFSSLGSWAASQPLISLVIVQSWYDDIGRVFSGRYYNQWRQMAPMLPLESDSSFSDTSRRENLYSHS